MRDPLFIRKEFTLHSGGKGTFKIECDSLTDEDIETLAMIVNGRLMPGIRQVYGVPRGGLRLSQALERYVSPDGFFDVIVDDVLTSGASMQEARNTLGWKNALGIVIFSRGPTPSWIQPIFQMFY